MTPHEFITKWQNSKLKERAAAQEHFLDMCRLLGEKTPAEVDAEGRDYGFEVGATKTGGGHGFADVFKRGHFAWEYKGTRANLDAALLQLQRYPKLGQVWCVGSDLIEHHKREFLTLSREWLEAANRRYPVLGNVIDARNEVSLRWLQWMGFSLVGKIDRFGVEQRPFIEFVKCAS